MNKSLILIRKFFVVVSVVAAVFVQNLQVAAVLAAPDLPQAPDNSYSEIKEPDEPQIAVDEKEPKRPDSPDEPDNKTPDEEDINKDEKETDESLPENEQEQKDKKDEQEGDDNYAETAEDMQVPDAPQIEKNSQSSGGEKKDGQTGGASIDTGDSEALGTVLNTGNTNYTTDSGPAFSSESSKSGQINVVNDKNGTNSQNTSDVYLVEEYQNEQTNQANVKNNLEIESSSGSNSASRNVGGDNVIETGDATAVGTIVNSVNTNIAGAMVSEFNIADGQNGDLVLDYESACVSGCDQSINLLNSDNGSNSENSNEVFQQNTDTTFQKNDADVENNLVLIADTGNNSTDSNTGGDNKIKTGDANVSGNVINMLNNNFAGKVIYGVVNVVGDFVGDIIVPEKYASVYETGTSIDMANNSNGSGSENSNNMETLSSEGFSQYNNSDIVNNLLVDANTGENKTSKNTNGNNDIDSGNVNVDSSILNLANNNVVGGDWWIVMVNDAGNWIGKIFAPQDALNTGNLAVKGGQMSKDETTGVVTLSNTGNGANSENKNAVSTKNQKETIQENQAKLTNNISLTANTGKNSASKNTGGASNIETGDANIQFNLINFLNNNFAGGNVYLNVVNVFGTWSGNFVTPGSDYNNGSEKSIGGDSGALSSNESSEQKNSSQENSGQEQSSAGQDSADNVAERASLGGSSSDSSQADLAQQQQQQGVLGTYFGGSETSANSGSSEKLAGGVADEVKEIEIVDSAQASGGEDENKRKINLAWGVLLVPIYLIARILRSRFSS